MVEKLILARVFYEKWIEDLPVSPCSFLASVVPLLLYKILANTAVPLIEIPRKKEPRNGSDVNGGVFPLVIHR